MSQDLHPDTFPESDKLNENELVQMDMPLGIFAGHLYQRAIEYVDTLRILIGHDGAPLRPAEFLFAHALELGLKSFLAARGVSRRELERRMRHDLVKF